MSVDGVLAMNDAGRMPVWASARSEIMASGLGWPNRNTMVRASGVSIPTMPPVRGRMYDDSGETLM